jgi:site-specific DNA-methyltransferase (adenine-specific)
MILTDPPYGTTACKWDSIIPLEPMWEQLKRIIKPNGAIVMTASQPFTTTLIASNMKMFKYCWVWDKRRVSNPQLAKFQPLKCHEDIVVFSLGGKKTRYYPQGLKDVIKIRKKDSSELGHCVRKDYIQTQTGYPKTIQTFSFEQGLHPTQKPVALMEYLIRTYTNEGETVLDFTMGSGTTGVACVNLNRNFIGIELDEGYFKIAEERIQKAKELRND